MAASAPGRRKRVEGRRKKGTHHHVRERPELGPRAVDVRAHHAVHVELVVALALQLLLVEVDVILFDVDNRLSQEVICFSDECWCDLQQKSQKSEPLNDFA